MKKLAKYLIACLFLFTLAAPSPALSLHHPGMPNWAPSNFDRVSDRIFRGGKIESFEQLRKMHEELGIDTVVNLAKDSLGPAEDNEIMWTKKLEMSYLPVYLGTEPPSAKKWEKIKNLMQAGKIYVHCRHGADRTGAIVAKYREEVENWTPDRAYKEARSYGFKPWLSSLKSWIGVGK